MTDGVWRQSPAPLLQANAVHVWTASLAHDLSHLETLQGLLSAEEVNRAHRFHYARDRHRFIAGRGQLRMLLGHYLDQPPESIHFDYSAYGKPSVTNERGLTFNISHADDMALYAFAYQAEIGVDIEAIKMDFPVEDISQHYFSTTEIAVLSRLPDDLKHRAFFTCWTRKEAYIKARGEGLSIPLDSFDVSLTPGEPASLLVTRDQPTEAAEWSLFDLQPGPGYAGALAIRGHHWQLSLRDYTPSFDL